MSDGRRWSTKLKKASVTFTVTLCAVFGLQLVNVSSAFANAANPDPTTAGTFTMNANGTVTAELHGTWTFENQSCAGRYGQGYAIDWWGISSSPLPNPNFTLTDATMVTGPGQSSTGSVTATGSIEIDGSGSYFHVGPHYAGESVNSPSTCTDVGKNSIGAWSASATYPSQSDIPPAVCVNMYDDHGKQGQPSRSTKDYSPIEDHDNSIQTNDFDPTMGNGYCVALQPAGQTIQGEIYQCVNGAPTTTLVSGGSIAVPSASLSSANPLAPTQVPAGTYLMNATAPPGQQFVACGQSGVTITSPGSANQSVSVPAGGAGDGRFYATASGSGYLEVCKSSANSVSGTFGFYISALHRTINVPAGACSHPIRVPAGVVLVEEAAKRYYEFASVSANPSDRVVNIDPARHNISVRVLAGGVAKEVIVIIDAEAIWGDRSSMHGAGQNAPVRPWGGAGSVAQDAVDRRDDADLLHACRQGDARAWDTLVCRYERLIFTVARRNGLSREDAADVTQTTFVALLDSIGGLRDDQRLTVLADDGRSTAGVATARARQGRTAGVVARCRDRRPDPRVRARRGGP